LVAPQHRFGRVVIACVALVCTLPCLGQTSPQDSALQTGSISGMVVDRSGAFVAGAKVRLTREDQALSQETLIGGDGQFSFTNITPGTFQLTVTSTGFATQTFSGTLGSGANYMVPQIELEVATAITEVQVELTQTEVAQEQIKVEEKQRVLGVIPNFYVSYISDPVPLSSKQKFQIAWKTVVDPVTFVLVGGIAGVEQAQNHFSGYGQGVQGYAKRYGAGYADTVAGTFIGSAILPSLLKQDPRYFYKGTGGTESRILYAMANSVICKGDNGRWQANYSNILGSLAAGGISNLYYPAQDRNGAGLTFENGAIGIGATAIANLFQEFVVRKFTPKLPNRVPENNPPGSRDTSHPAY
jgi:Carboxypeptidase regulatory-like domain